MDKKELFAEYVPFLKLSPLEIEELGLGEDRTNMAKEIVFLLKHLVVSQENDMAQFKYGGIELKISGILKLESTSMYSEQEDYYEQMIISSFRNSDDFKKAYKVFLRDNKLNDILDD